MKVYILRPDYNKYRDLYYVNKQEVLEFDGRFDGTPMKNSWTGKERFEFYPEPKPKGDFPGYSTHIPVFNPRALRTLGDLLEGNGELLPISCDGEDYFLFNVTRVIDALDKANCDLTLFSDGRILDVDRYSFFRQALIGAKLFKIPESLLSDIFVTDVFVERVKKSKLTGFKFRPVWSDDTR